MSKYFWQHSVNYINLKATIYSAQDPGHYYMLCYVQMVSVLFKHKIVVKNVPVSRMMRTAYKKNQIFSEKSGFRK